MENLKRAREKYRHNRVDHEYKEQERIRAHRRRAALARFQGPDFTKAEFVALCEQYNNRCVCCGGPGYCYHCGGPGPLEPDHIAQVTNIKRGRLPEPACGGNAIGNIQPLCARCNVSRNASTGPYLCICGREFKHKTGVRRIRPHSNCRRKS